MPFSLVPGAGEVMLNLIEAHPELESHLKVFNSAVKQVRRQLRL